MECQVQETVYCLFGITPILDDVDEQVVRPLLHHRYGNGRPDTPAPPKMILITSEQRGCGERALCSAIVNELRRGKSNKRGDVHYQNREVKYLEWNYRRDRRPADLLQILSAAKDQELTVLTIPSIDHVCPANLQRAGNGDPAGIIKLALLEQVKAVPDGKILVITTTTNEKGCDEEVLKQMEYKYFLPLPDADAREEIILGTLERENAELKPPDTIDKLVRVTRHGYSTSDIMYAINGALRVARQRQREQQQNGGRSGVLTVLWADWTRCLDILLEERDGMDAREDSDEDEEDMVGFQPVQPYRLWQARQGGGEENESDDDVQIVDEFPLNNGLPQARADLGLGEEADNEADDLGDSDLDDA